MKEQTKKEYFTQNGKKNMRNTNLIIFGASGDLAKLMLFPSIYTLAKHNRLPKNFKIIGFARTEKTQELFKKEFKESIKNKIKEKIDNKILSNILKNTTYISGDYDNLEDYKKLKSSLEKNSTNIAYLSVPPNTFKPIIKNLGITRTENEDIRLIIEKPFGENGTIATKLYHYISNHFSEKEIFLLDHYLGKTSVQSILELRHSNKIFNLLINGQEIDNIQITAFEEIGITNRGGYYDQVGTIKDVIQSHLLLLLALTTMAIPINKTAEALHNERYGVLSALHFANSQKNILTGQYSSYKKEKDIPKDSITETYAAVKLSINRENWFQVPIYIRTGKKLKEKNNYIAIQFKQLPFANKNDEANILKINLQPKASLSIQLNRKEDKILTEDSLECSSNLCLPEHSFLLLEVMNNHHLHFLSFKEIIATWKVVDKIIKYIKTKKIKPTIYKDNSNGPIAQNKFTKWN